VWIFKSSPLEYIFNVIFSMPRPHVKAPVQSQSLEQLAAAVFSRASDRLIEINGTINTKCVK
jgi:hypothetical protein